MDTEKIKSSLYDCMINAPGMTVSQALIKMAKSPAFLDEQLNRLSIDDLSEVSRKVDADRVLGERFEKIINLTDELIVLRDTYENGNVSLPGFTSQAEFKILSLVKGQQRLGTCYRCGNDKNGAMEFICNDCEIIPE